jgi:hypothetical protein
MFSSISCVNVNCLRLFPDKIWLMQIQLYRMVRTQGNRGRGASSQGPPMPPPPSPELALILHSLEAINETLKGHHPVGIEVEPPPSGEGNPEASRDSGGGPPRGHH